MSQSNKEVEAEALRAYQLEAWAPYLDRLAGTTLTQAEKELVADACADLEVESRFNPALLDLVARLSAPAVPGLTTQESKAIASVRAAQDEQSWPECGPNTMCNSNHLGVLLKLVERLTK